MSMVYGFLKTLTVEERISLHLLDNPLPKSKDAVELYLTQAGISAAIHVQRKHLPRALKKMIAKEEILEENRHVVGAKQIRRVYGLTAEGVARSQIIRKKVLDDMANKEGIEIQIGTLLEKSDSFG